MIENLEGRRFLTAVLGADGVLTITGTGGSDHILVSAHTSTPHHAAPQNQIVVQENHSIQAFDAALVTRVVINGGAGNDSLAASHLTKPVEINGGDGSDRLVGGDAADSLSGGNGHDILSGGGRNDTLDGGAGRDYLLGGDGDDLLLARDGEQDVVNGGSGNNSARVDRTTIVHDGHHRRILDRVFHVATLLP